MQNKEIDVKAVAERMEKHDDGCALLFNEAFQLLNKDFKAQMNVVDKIEQESKSHPDSKLTFDHLKGTGADPSTKRDIAFEGVNISSNGKKIFQEIMTSVPGTNKIISVQKACKPG